MTQGEVEGEPRKSEEWEEWMDWEKTEDHASSKATDESPRRSMEEAYQLPSPGASIGSDLGPESIKRRKLSPGGQDSALHGKKGAPEQKVSQAKNHSIVEKRYRTNLNQKIVELGTCLPSLKKESANRDWREANSDPPRHNKGTILTEAISYIEHLERRNKYLEQAYSALQQQSAQPLTTAGPPAQDVTKSEPSPSEISSPSPTSSPIAVDGDSNTAQSPPVEGLIKVPEEWKRLWRRGKQPAEPEATRDDEDKPAAATPSDGVKLRGGKYVGRLMVGTLAGLVVMDNLASYSPKSSDDRGLFALPFLRFRSSLTNFPLTERKSISSHGHMAAPVLKCFLAFGILGLLLFIYLFTSRPPPQKPRAQTVLPPTSITSPLEVRQRAFLTAIQTIWVPRHHVLPEMLALTVETAAYIIRQLLGWRTYSCITGRSEDEELARVKAWDTAIDAQLSGGDAEISKSRLVLSLWASGTLPSSPARFMLKALHIRILFWQPSRFIWLNEAFHGASCRLARWQWNKARKMQATTQKGKANSTSEPLIHHLATLVRFSHNEVLTAELVSQAHNLTWNTSTSELYLGEVAEDSAMHGPLDALSTWYSELRLKGLLDQLSKSPNAEFMESLIPSLLVVAKCAPAGSLTKAKALALEAVLDSSRRSVALEKLSRNLSPSFPTSEGRIATDSVPDPHQRDLQDIQTCRRSAMLLERISGSEGLSTTTLADLVDLVGSLRNETKPDLLGMNAVKYLLYNIRDYSQSDEAVSQQLRAAPIRNVLRGAAVLADVDVQKGPVSEQERASRIADKELPRRRPSGASNDTGYGSMSDDGNDLDDSSSATSVD